VKTLPDQRQIALPENAEPYVVAQNYEGYTNEERHTWKSLYDWRMEQLLEHACHEYLQGLSVLGITGQNIPVIDHLNAALRKRAEWRLLPVKGFLPSRTFFDLLAARIFPTTTYLRKPESLDYTPEPDIFHDVFGHVPMHAHRVFADYLQAFAQLARRIETEPEQEFLGRLFWYTVEFGLIRQQGKVKLYGSGVISSQKESTKVVEGRQEIHDFDLEEVLKTPVKVDELQPVLFVIDSFEQIYAASQEAARLFGIAG
jgi:phenylalanine-4-hydroxylase